MFVEFHTKYPQQTENSPQKKNAACVQGTHGSCKAQFQFKRLETRQFELHCLSFQSLAQSWTSTISTVHKQFTIHHGIFTCVRVNEINSNGMLIKRKACGSLMVNSDISSTNVAAMVDLQKLSWSKYPSSQIQRANAKTMPLD